LVEVENVYIVLTVIVRISINIPTSDRLQCLLQRVIDSVQSMATLWMRHMLTTGVSTRIFFKFGCR